MPAAPILAAVAAVAGTGYAVYSGERGASMQRAAVRRQKDAEKQAEFEAARNERIANEERNKAEQKSPNLDVLLNQQDPKPGALGIDTSRLLLGNRFLGR